MIHPTATIHPTAQIADTAEIGPYAIIGENCRIGANTSVGAFSVIEFAEIGENCKIFSHAAVGTAPQDLKYKNERTKIVIGKNCIIREFTTLNRGSTASGKTVIGYDCLFMAYTHVAHDCIVGNGVIMANSATLGGHVEVGDFAVLSSHIAVHQFARIGRMVMLGGGSMSNLDILPYAQAQGDRAKLKGLNLVGMKRKGFTDTVINEIKNAYRTLFLSGLTIVDALDQLEAASPGPEVREMIDFARSSKRGICRPSRKVMSEEM